MDSLGFVNDGVYDYKGKTFEHDIHIIPTTVLKPKYIRFFQCVFKKSLTIRNLNEEKISVSFSNCLFEDGIFLQNCTFSELKLLSFKAYKDINIEKVNVNLLKVNSRHLLKCNMLSIIRDALHAFHIKHCQPAETQALRLYPKTPNNDSVSNMC